MFSEAVHRLTLPAFAVVIVLTVWVLAWQRSTAAPNHQQSMPPLMVDHRLAESAN